MDYLPVLAGLSAAFFWGISDYIVSKPAREIGQYKTATYTLLVSALVILPALAYAGVHTHASIFVLLMGVIASVITFLGFFYSYRSMRYGDVSIVAPIFGAYPAITVAGAVLILGDILSNVEIIAIAAVILGIILVSTKFSAFGAKRRIVSAGVGSAIISMFFLGVLGLFAGAFTVAIGFVLFSLMQRGIGSASGFITGYVTKQDISIPKRKFLPRIIAGGATDAFGLLAWMYGIFRLSTSLPIIAAIAGFAGGVTVICGFLFLRERPEANQWLGILLAIIGVAILSYFA